MLAHRIGLRMSLPHLIELRAQRVRLARQLHQLLLLELETQAKPRRLRRRSGGCCADRLGEGDGAVRLAGRRSGERLAPRRVEGRH